MHVIILYLLAPLYYGYTRNGPSCFPTINVQASPPKVTLGLTSTYSLVQCIDSVSCNYCDSIPSLCSPTPCSYAPWCPACQQFTETWERFAQWAAEDKSFRLRVGKVDVSVETSELNTCSLIVFFFLGTTV